VLQSHETWIRLDDPPAIANDAAPNGFKIANVTRCRSAAGSSTAQRSSSSDSTHIVGGGLAVIYRDDLMVRQHPLRDKLSAVTSFEQQLVRVGSTAPFLAVVNVYRPPSTDVGIYVNELANVLATIVSGCNDHLMLCQLRVGDRPGSRRTIMNDVDGARTDSTRHASNAW